MVVSAYKQRALQLLSNPSSLSVHHFREHPQQITLRAMARLFYFLAALGRLAPYLERR